MLLNSTVEQVSHSVLEVTFLMSWLWHK